MTTRPRDDGSDAIDGWIQLALDEYEQIAAICNASSLLGNAAASATTVSSSSHAAISTHHRQNNQHDGNDDEGCLHPQYLRGVLQRHDLFDKLSSYYDAIDAVRRTHASLKSKLTEMQRSESDDEEPNDIDNSADSVPSRRRRRQPSALASQELHKHIELIERVIRTVMMQPSQNKSGPCGILFENGIVRTSSAAESHEVNVVALSALRASVSKLKENFHAGGGR